MTRMYSVEFERQVGDLGVSVVLLADNPLAAIDQAFTWFPEYLREGFRGDVFEAEYAEIDWDSGRSFVVRKRLRPQEKRLSPKGELPKGEGQR